LKFRESRRFVLSIYPRHVPHRYFCSGYTDHMLCGSFFHHRGNTSS
jgi:hypothetical protein